MNSPKKSAGKGLVCAFFAFSAWGVLPLYWRQLAGFTAFHILALRILFSLVLVSIILFVNKNLNWIRVFKDRKKGFMTILAALVLCSNWGIYIWAVNRGRTIEASLGYYINPLVSVAMGLLFFREKMLRLQWVAFGFAGVGVVILTIFSGSVPWISLVLAVTFATYGLLKKTSPLSSMESLGAETLASSPLALCLLFFSFASADRGGLRLIAGWQNISYIAELPAQTWFPALFIGFVSAFPLYFFAHAAKLLPLSSLGFAQLLSPTLQFLVGFFIFKENFPAKYFIAYSFIWLAMVLYVVSLRRKAR